MRIIFCGLWSITQCLIMSPSGLTPLHCHRHSWQFSQMFQAELNPSGYNGRKSKAVAKGNIPLLAAAVLCACTSAVPPRWSCCWPVADLELEVCLVTPERWDSNWAFAFVLQQHHLWLSSRAYPCFPAALCFSFWDLPAWKSFSFQEGWSAVYLTWLPWTIFLPLESLFFFFSSE